MGTNIRIAGRTYRDIENMSLMELQQLSMAMAKEAARLSTLKINQSNIGQIETQLKEISKRIPFIERLINRKTTQEQNKVES